MFSGEEETTCPQPSDLQHYGTFVKDLQIWLASWESWWQDPGSEPQASWQMEGVLEHSVLLGEDKPQQLPSVCSPGQLRLGEMKEISKMGKVT